MDKSTITKIIRWAARISGTLILAFLLFFVIAHIVSPEENGQGFQSHREIYMFILFPVTTMVGLALAWKWEGLGGLLITVAMTIFHTLGNDNLGNFYLMAPFIPGVLYILYWLRTKLQQTH